MHKSGKKHIAIIGASGGVGEGLCMAYAQSPHTVLHAFARRTPAHHAYDHFVPMDITDPESVRQAAHQVDTALDIVVIATGVLSTQKALPEKSVRDIDRSYMEDVFLTNFMGPALVARYFIPLMRRSNPTVFAVLAARVGSIADNHLGGWYSYRASKAALVQFIRTLAIEQSRRNSEAICVALHPGTVDTALAMPFRKNIPANRLFSVREAGEKLKSVMDTLQTQDSGKHIAYDGQVIPY